MFAIQFAPATVALCNTYGLTQYGVCAVVLRDGIEVYRTRGFAKRAGARAAAQDWITAQARVVFGLVRVV